MQQLILNTIIGAASGWLTSQAGKGGPWGLVGNLVSGGVGGNVLAAVVPMLMGGGDTNSMLTNGLASLVGGGGATLLSSFIKKPNA